MIDGGAGLEGLVKLMWHNIWSEMQAAIGLDWRWSNLNVRVSIGPHSGAAKKHEW